MQWPDLGLAVALVKTPHRSSAATMNLLNKPQELRLMAVALPHQTPLCHVLLLPTSPSKWPELVLAVALELRSIAVALALSLSFLLALTASSSAPHSGRELFTEPLKKLKELTELMKL